ncbi:MAG: hypothetical protein OES79_03320 [Planctomycetota bacterium]|nr:hypothetical protein [Planctomycetota bacterium]
MRLPLLFSFVLTGALVTGLSWRASAEDDLVPIPARSVSESSIKDTAIALNYCRASFHRIRKYPVAPVLAQEKEKILNNLNLHGIEDPEVIELYTAVLDEINDTQVVQQERRMHQVQYRMSVQRRMAWDLLAFGTDLATGSLGSAIRQGANSWWDYRGLAHQRDSDLWKADKDRFQSVTQKSSDFLSTSWKLARLKNIPDRWLVRSDDLDALEAAYGERDPKIRLRVLRRMEPYMQAYPPYWYYVGRTQQELGQLPAAAETYRDLVRVGDGHFRKDDMLASSVANLAAIEEDAGKSNAVALARRALQYSTDAWEANLICARILQHHGRLDDAEDAILRNLDVELETTQSRVFLASLYFHADKKQKLARFIANPEVVAGLPAPVLLRCAACLGAEQTPPPVLAAVLAALDVQPRLQFGPDELVVRMSPAWQLHLAHVDVSLQGRQLHARPLENVAGAHQLRFAERFEFGGPLAMKSDDVSVEVRFTYPDRTVVQVTIGPDRRQQDIASMIALVQTPASHTRTAATGMLKVAGIAVNDTPIPLTHVAARSAAESVGKE